MTTEGQAENLHEPSFHMDLELRIGPPRHIDLELRVGPSRYPTPAPINVEASSSRRARRMQLNISVQMADNNQHNNGSGVDSQVPPANIRDFNALLVGTGSSMSEPDAPPQVPLPPLAPSPDCPVCMGSQSASSSMLMPVQPPPPPQPPTFMCPICQGPLAEPTATRCGHLFCQECISVAVAVRPRCPVCRRRVVLRHLNRIYFPDFI